MNWLEFIKRKGVGFKLSWKWGKPIADKDFCKKCKTHKDKHWVESHPFQSDNSGGKDNVG